MPEEIEVHGEAVKVKLDCEQVAASLLPAIELPEEEIGRLEDLLAQMEMGEYEDLRSYMRRVGP